MSTKSRIMFPSIRICWRVSNVPDSPVFHVKRLRLPLPPSHPPVPGVLFGQSC